MIVTSVQIKTVKTQKHLYCPVFTQNGSQYWLPLIKSAFATNTYNKKQTTVWDALSVFYKCDSDLGALDCKFTV